MVAVPVVCVLVAVYLQVKKASHLRPWLFQQGSEFSDPVSVTRFDRLDFVFMYGDPKLLPWSKAARQARILLRMCYNTGKATFCAGFGGQLLAYVSATGSRELHVVNGGGNGGDLEDITRCPVPTVDGRWTVGCSRQGWCLRPSHHNPVAWRRSRPPRVQHAGIP